MEIVRREILLGWAEGKARVEGWENSRRKKKDEEGEKVYLRTGQERK